VNSSASDCVCELRWRGPAGVFYPYNRGLLYTAQIVLYAMTAGISGYTSAYMFRQMGGDRWARHLLLTCVIFAGPFFLMFCVLNTVAISYRCVCLQPHAVPLSCSARLTSTAKSELLNTCGN
jgi:hypothetical protein